MSYLSCAHPSSVAFHFRGKAKIPQWPPLPLGIYSLQLSFWLTLLLPCGLLATSGIPLGLVCSSSRFPPLPVVCLNVTSRRSTLAALFKIANCSPESQAFLLYYSEQLIPGNKINLFIALSLSCLLCVSSG